MRKELDYTLLQEFFQKKIVAHERSDVKNYYLCYTPYGLFWLNLYLENKYENFLTVNVTDL